MSFDMFAKSDEKLRRMFDIPKSFRKLTATEYIDCLFRTVSWLLFYACFHHCDILINDVLQYFKFVSASMRVLYCPILIIKTLVCI